MLKTWITGTKDFTDQGLAPSEWINDNVTIVDGGKLGKCMSFNGSTSRLSITGYELGNKWSFACWVKDDSSVTAWQMVLGLNNNGSDADIQMGLWLKSNENRLEHSYNGTYNSNIPYTPNQWNHFVGTYDGSSAKFYINGELKATNSHSGNLSRANLTIGARCTNANGAHTSIANPFKGLINDVRIWDDHALSPMEVKKLSQGLILHYPLDNNGVGGENLAIGTDVASSTNGKMYNLSSTIPSGTKVTISCWIDADNVTMSGNKRIGLSIGIIRSDESGTQWFETWVSYDKVLSNNGSFHGRISNTQTILGNMSSIGAYIQTLSSGTVSISQIKVEIGDHPTPWCLNSSDTLYTTLGYNDNIEYDTSGFGNNGTRTGTFSWTSDTPKYSVSTVLPNNYATYIYTTGLEQQIFTWACWFKILGAGAGASQRIISEGRDTGSRGAEIWVSQAGTTLYAQAHSSQTSTTIALNTWYHVVMTCDGSNRKLYLNGSLIQTGAYTADADYAQSNGKFVIGKMSYRYTDTDNYFPLNGQVSDVRIYATALSPEDILSLYQASAYIDSQGNTYASSYVEG